MKFLERTSPRLEPERDETRRKREHCRHEKDRGEPASCFERTSSTIRFSSLTGNAYGPVINNVSVSAVPEVATWAMMLLGFGMVGAGLRYRRKSTGVRFA